MARDVFATVRRLSVLTCLPREERHGVTVDDIVRRVRNQIAEEVPVTPKRVREDLAYLSSVGRFPIMDDAAHRNRRFWWSSKTLFEVPSMSIDTALALVLMKEHTASLLPNAVLEAVEPHFERAEAILQRPRARTLASWQDKIRVVPRQMQLQPAAVDPTVMRCIHQALLEDRRVEVRYRAVRRNRPRVHELSPLGLLHRGSVIELIAVAAGRPEPGR